MTTEADTETETETETVGVTEMAPVDEGRRADGIDPATVPVEVIDRARDGDQMAFDALYRTYHPGLRRYLHTIGAAFAADAAAATWVSVVGGLSGFRGDGRDFRRWLFTIGRRRLVDEVRRNAHRSGGLRIVADPVDPEPTAADLAGDQEWIEQMLATLPSRQADVVMLRVLGGLSAAEVAALLGITDGNVRVLTHRALNRLREQLDDQRAASSDPADGPEISSAV
mgnify:FL=1